jgi:coproporphyrinogen III oxidase
LKGSNSTRFVSLSPDNRRSFAAGSQHGRSIVDGNIFNSKGVHVAVVIGPTIFDRKGQKLYDLRGVNIYKLNGDLVGHLSDARGA